MFKEVSKISRIMVGLTGLILIAVYFLPIWQITITAPQYPDALGLNIWINKITGMNEFDLLNINLLNHYIGMKIIDEHSIIELQYMPYILYFMIAGALVTFVYDRLVMIYLGMINILIVFVAGLYDFWRWEYDYGHNLNPDAPISIAGMTYQPPLLGCKTLLNIHACSMPHFGGWLLIITMGLLGFILYYEKYVLPKK